MCGESTDAAQVARLTGGEVAQLLHADPPSECAVMSDRLFLATSAYWRDSLIPLTVRSEGDYREHLAQLEGAQSHG